jgi:hypothetical protein
VSLSLFVVIASFDTARVARHYEHPAVLFIRCGGRQEGWVFPSKRSAGFCVRHGNLLEA